MYCRGDLHKGFEISLRAKVLRYLCPRVVFALFVRLWQAMDLICPDDVPGCIWQAVDLICLDDVPGFILSRTLGVLERDGALLFI